MRSRNRRVVPAGSASKIAGNHRMVPIATEARVWMEDDGSGTRLRDRDPGRPAATAVCRRHGDGGGRGVHAGRRYSRRVPSTPNDKLPIKMLNDRLLVRIPDKDGERRTQGGILIPATAQMAKRLVWAEVVALGENVRSAEVGDLVLFSPEDRYEVEVQGSDYIMLRERDLHAVAADAHRGVDRAVSVIAPTAEQLDARHVRRPTASCRRSPRTSTATC